MSYGKQQIIETKRVILREVEPGDAEAVFELFNDPEVMKYFENTPHSIEEAHERIQRDINYYTEHGFGFWAAVLKDTGKVIGQCGLLAQVVDEVNETEIGYALARKYRGQGFATEATKAIKNYSFNKLKFNRLISIIDPQNIASQKVALRNGLAFEKTTIWMDKQVKIYSVQKT
jgi:ribosomal-protein-alanine N-acetyltransferase